MKTALVLLGCICSLLVSGCASTRQMVPLPDQAKRIEDPSKGRVYVMRPSSLGAAIRMTVLDGGTTIGVTGPAGYLCWERPPGDTTITATAEGVSQAPLSVSAGEVYYVFEHIRMGWWQAANKLEVVNEEEGQKVLKKCHAPTVISPTGTTPVKGP
jgi:hypothetical protein